MAQDKKQLEALLHFIDRLIAEPGNEWFAERLRSSVSISREETETNDQASIDSMIRLQHCKNRRKARKYYQHIKNDVLRNQLITDHASMLWYKSIYEIEMYFTHVNYQIENMLNYYLENTDFHKKVQKDPKRFCTTVSFHTGKQLTVDVYTFAFDKYKNYEPVSVPKIKSLWAKIVFWAIDTDSLSFLQNQASNFSAIINIRNENNHSYYGRNETTLFSTYWKNLEDDMYFAFIGGIIRVIRDTIIKIQK